MRRARLRAFLGDVLEFTTWQSLARSQGLDDEAAIDLLVELAGCLAKASLPSRERAGP